MEDTDLPITKFRDSERRLEVKAMLEAFQDNEDDPHSVSKL